MRMFRFRLRGFRAQQLGRRLKTTLVEKKGVAPEDVHIFYNKDQTALKVKQAPNRDTPWAPSQRPRADAMSGPRFENIDLETQPRPLAAIDLIYKQPVNYVHHIAVCDGNYDGKHGGVEGHPKVFINVDKPGIHGCVYCGTCYADEHHKEKIDAGEITDVYYSSN